MDTFLAWLQNLPVFVTIAESATIWGYPTVLMLHTVGLGWLVGLNTVVNLRLLGVGKRVPLETFESLFPMMWWGFWLNLWTGVILFCLDAGHKAHQWVFWAKIVAIALALVTLQGERNYLFRSGEFPGGDLVSAKGKRYAWASLTLWWIATATGRLTAYIG
jgi:hypothetical protein